MAVRYGKFLAGVFTGLRDKLAPGHSSNAALRRTREVFLLDEAGAIVAIDTNLGIGALRGGDVLDHLDICAGTASLAGVSFSVGNATNKTKYSVATVGPAANATVRIKFIDAVDSAGTEELFLWTTVGALPTTAGAKLQTELYVSHK